MANPQVVLVTGSSSGFGRLTVETLARRAHRVFASMRDIHGKNTPAKAEVESLAGQENLLIQVIELDVTDDRSVENAVATVMAQAGRIDVVVNNAGVGCLGITEGYTLQQIQALFDTNLFGVVRVNRAVLPHMRRLGSGLLVHITSVAGRVVFPFMGPYCTTKFALEALAESYHHDLAPFGIDSIMVEPGLFHTNIGKTSVRPVDKSRLNEFGAVKQKVVQMERAFESYVAPDAQEVADTITKLIALPVGQRPLRTLVGPDARLLERLNQVATEVQEEELRWLGLGDLLAARPAR